MAKSLLACLAIFKPIAYRKKKEFDANRLWSYQVSACL